MRLINIAAACLLAAGPLFALCPSAQAEQNDLLGRAQQFLNNKNDNQTNQNAYERGREDERSREQARRDRRDAHDNDQPRSNRDLRQDGRSIDQDRETYNYNRYP